MKVRDLRLEIYDVFHSFDVEFFENTSLTSGEWFIVLNFVHVEQAEIARTTYSIYTTERQSYQVYIYEGAEALLKGYALGIQSE